MWIAIAGDHEIERPARLLRPGRIVQVALHVFDRAVVGRELVASARQHVLGEILQRQPRRRERVEHRLGDDAGAAADIEHVDLGVGRKRHRRDQRLQDRHALGHAARIARDPVVDIAMGMPVVPVIVVVVIMIVVMMVVVMPVVVAVTMIVGMIVRMAVAMRMRMLGIVRH